MTDLYESDSDGDLTERGPLQKEMISKTLFKRKQDELKSYFEGFREFMKNVNQSREGSDNNLDLRKKMFNVFSHELDVSLTQAQKNSLVKLWKPAVAPVVLVGDIKELEEVRTYLNSKNLARVKLDERKQIVDLMKVQPNSTNRDFSSEIKYVNSNNGFSNGTMEISPLSNDTSTSDATSTFKLFSRDLREELREESKEESNTNEGNMESEEYPFEEIYMKLSNEIKTNSDIDNEINDLKSKVDTEIFQKLINYTWENHEPIIFQLAMRLESYKHILDVMIKEGVLELNQRNYMGISMFTFMLINDIKGLHKLLIYLMNSDKINEVKNVCLRDKNFKKAFIQKKKEEAGAPVQVRLLVAAIEKLCFI